MSRKTNPIGLRLGIRKLWLSEGSLSFYSEQTRQALFVRRLAESMLKRLRMQPLEITTRARGASLNMSVNLAKRRIKRAGSRLTIRRRKKLRFRRWGRRGGRSFDRLKPFTTKKSKRRRFLSRRLFLRKFWSKIRPSKLRRFWRLAICCRLRRHKRRVFWQLMRSYLYKQLRCRRLLNSRLRFTLMRNPIVSNLRRFRKLSRQLVRMRARRKFRSKARYRLRYLTRTSRDFSAVFSRFTKDWYFPSRFSRLLDDRKRIKWPKKVLRNASRYMLSSLIALWLPSAKVMGSLIAHALRAHRAHWQVLRFFDHLISRLQPLTLLIQGITIEIRGKFNKRMRAIKFKRVYGRPIPINTLDTRCDYVFCEAYTYVGVFGIRIWFYYLDSVKKKVLLTKHVDTHSYKIQKMSKRAGSMR